MRDRCRAGQPAWGGSPASRPPPRAAETVSDALRRRQEPPGPVLEADRPGRAPPRHHREASGGVGANLGTQRVARRGTQLPVEHLDRRVRDRLPGRVDEPSADAGAPPVTDVDPARAGCARTVTESCEPARSPACRSAAPPLSITRFCAARPRCPPASVTPQPQRAASLPVSPLAAICAPVCLRARRRVGVSHRRSPCVPTTCAAAPGVTSTSSAFWIPELSVASNVSGSSPATYPPPPARSGAIPRDLWRRRVVRS